MKKKIGLACVILIMIISVICIETSQKNTMLHMEMNKEIKVEGHMANPQKAEFPINIETAGEYRLTAEWKPDKEGMQTGCVLLNEEGEILYEFSAEWITLTSEPIMMEPGNYFLNLYFIGGSEQYMSFSDLVGWESDEAAIVEWEEQYAKDGIYNIKYIFTVESDGSIGLVIPILLLVVVCGVFLMLVMLKDIRMNKQHKKIIFLLASVVLAILLYVLLHEMGHCIVAIACGATITEYSIITAHMSYSGGSFTDTSDLWLHANGVVFPLILSYVYVLCYKKEKESTLYRIFSYIVAIMPVFTALVWVAFPILYMGGNTPASDDITKFLDNFSTRYHPIWVTVGALVLIMLLVILVIKKRIIHNAVMEFKRK